MKTYCKTLFPLFCILNFSFLHPVQAQWQYFPFPQGLPTNSFVRHQGHYFINFGGNVFRSPDGIHWQSVASPAPYDLQILSDGTRLYADLLYNNYGLYVSDDNGETWMQTNLPSSNIPYEVVVSPDALYAYHAGGTAVYKSTDQGAAWQLIFSESNSNMNSMDVHDSVIVVLTSQHLMRSADAGATWTEVSNTIKGATDGTLWVAWVPVYYTGDNTWFVQNVFSRSTDDGLTWQPLALPPGYEYTARIMRYQGRVWMTNQQYPVNTFTSDNNGTSWTPDRIPGYQNQLLGVDDTLFAAGAMGCYYSLDNGAKWYAANKGDLTNFQGPSGTSPYRFFTSGNRLFSAGNVSNDIFYTENDGNDWHFVKAKNESAFEVKGDTVLAWPNQLSYDGGLHYTQFPDPMMVPYALADDAIWGVRWQEGIYRSTDGGLTWTNANFPGTGAVTSMVYARQGLWVTVEPNVYATFDNGGTWLQMNEGVGDPLELYYGRIFGSGNQLFLQTDEQLYFFENGRWHPSGYGDKKFPSGTSAVEVFENGKAAVINRWPKTEIYITGDGGKNWAKIRSEFPLGGPDRLLASGENLYALGDGFFKRDLSQIQISSVNGKVFDDQNANEVYDTGELPLKNASLYLTNSRITTHTDSAGMFNILVEMESGDTLFPAMYTQYYFSVPQYHVVGINGGTYDFAVQVNPGVQDISLTATNISVFRPGFNTDIVLTVNNPGSVAVAPEVHFPLSDSYVFVNALPAPTTVTDDEIIWHLSLLEPLARTDIRLTLYTLPDVPLGTDLSITAEAQPIPGDLTPPDNRSTIRTVVVGSFDPNDKQCDPEFISPEMALDGERVIYTVRFQNTGDYEANFVIISDTLSPNLDASTAEPLSASHPYRFIRHDDNILEIFFDNIRLPPSLWDSEGSHGFIKFAVRTRPGLVVGETVMNRAGIYFDFNPPVITNTVTTTVKTSGIHFEPAPAQLSVIPNPASDFVVFSAETAGKPVHRFRIADMPGRTALTVPAINSRGIVDVSTLPAGLYYVSAETEGSVVAFAKLVVARH